MNTSTSDNRTAITLGYLTIIAILPYVLLKAAWLSGSLIGISDPSKADDTALFALNALTLGLDSVAVTVVLAFTHGWGLRAPTWAVLLPMWVGAGLLVPIVLSAPVAAALEQLSGDGVAAAGVSFLEPWVTPVVYTSFTAQGLGIMAGFWLYARRRWPRVFRLEVGARTPRPTQAVYAVGAAIAVALTSLVVLVRLGWASGSTVGLPAEMVDSIPPSHYVTNLVAGLLAAGGAVGLVVLVHQVGAGRRLWMPLAATWTGSAAMWSWGIWGMLAVLSQGAQESLAGGRAGFGWLGWVSLVQVLAGMTMAFVGLLILVEAVSDRTGRRPLAPVRRSAPATRRPAASRPRQHAS